MDLIPVQKLAEVMDARRGKDWDMAKFSKGDKLKFKGGTTNLGFPLSHGGIVVDVGDDWYHIARTNGTKATHQQDYIEHWYELDETPRRAQTWDESLVEKYGRKNYMLELQDRGGAWTKILQDENKTLMTNTALRLHQILGVRVKARIRDYITGDVYAEMDFSGEDWA